MGKTKMRVIAICIALVLLALTTLHADELQDLSSADVAPTVEVAKATKGNLGEGTGNFAGALMTSGSFTMRQQAALTSDRIVSFVIALYRLRPYGSAQQGGASLGLMRSLN